MNGAWPSVAVSEELIRRFDRFGPRYTSYPTAEHFHGDFTERSYIRQLEQRKHNPAIARPGDELARPRFDHSLQRNFQGYTTRAAADLIGLGLSSVGKVGNAYGQSAGTLDAYYAELDAGCLPIEKGFMLAPDDVLRRAVIMALMCSGPLDFEAIGQTHDIDFRSYFAAELAQLQPYENAGLVEIGQSQLTVTQKGRLFVRGIGMVFDKYLAQPHAARHSTGT